MLGEVLNTQGNKPAEAHNHSRFQIGGGLFCCRHVGPRLPQEHPVGFPFNQASKARHGPQTGEEKAGQRLPSRFEICWGLLSVFQQVCRNLYTLFTLTESEDQLTI